MPTNCATLHGAKWQPRPGWQRATASAAWIAAFALLIIGASAALVEARPADSDSLSSALGHWTPPSEQPVSDTTAGAIKVAAKVRKAVRGAVAGAAAARRGREQDGNAAESEASPGDAPAADQPAEYSGPQPIALPPRPESAAAPAAQPAPAPAPATASSIAPASTAAAQAAAAGAGCIANCPSPPVARGRAQPKANPAQQATSPMTIAAPSAQTPPETPQTGIMCIAGCDGITGGVARARATEPQSGPATEMRPTTNDGNSRITVLRGVTRAKVYGVGR